MSVSRKDIIANIQKNRIKRRRTLETLVLLSVLVFTGVMWKLRMQGITLTDDVQYRCGLEQHQHFDACYEKDLICGMEQIEFLENGQPGHVHTDECYELRTVCGKEEHSHTAECFYEEESDSGGTSIEPSEGEEEPEGLPSESDSDEEDEEWEEDFDEEFEFDENFDFSAWLGGVSLLAAPVDPPYEVGAIYISTQLGEKHKDQVHEYLDGVYWWNSTKGYLNTPVLNTDGTPVLDGNGDPLYKYIGNGHEGDNPDLGYVLHPGDRIEICAYIPDYPKNASLAFIRGEQNPDNGRWDVLYHAQFISQENVSMGNGYRRVSAVIQAGSVGWEPVQLGYYSSPSISTDVGDVWSKFHINVKASDDNQYYTHADIEIDDDGFYNHIEDLTLKNGKTYRITTQYSTIISGVNYCKIYKSTDLNDDTQAVMYREVSPGVYEPWADQEYAYRPQDYKNIGASGSGQFEFTSEPNFAGTLHRVRYFKINEAGRAEFDVSVILKR
ncbi:MAG: hypothetical protein MJ114_00890, partial [Acetatifactor sp.]|nr:hypothetical protein [Acetatifactor sp.]